MKRVICLCLLFLVVWAPYVYAYQQAPGITRDGRYDFTFALFDGGLEDIAWDWPRVFASGKPVIINKEKNERQELEQKTSQGRAFIIPPYVLTLFHIVDLKTVRNSIMTPIGPMKIEFTADEVMNEEYWLLQNKESATKIPLQKIKLLPESDLALFKMPENMFVSYPFFDFGKSSELRVGNVIFLLGSPNLVGPVVRPGIISALGYQIEEVETNSPSGWDAKNWIIISTGVVKGDSGSPVVALRDGKPELVGIVNLQFSNIMGIMIAIDRVFDIIKTATGIDLRALRFGEEPQEALGI